MCNNPPLDHRWSADPFSDPLYWIQSKVTPLEWATCDTKINDRHASRTSSPEWPPATTQIPPLMPPCSMDMQRTLLLLPRYDGNLNLDSYCCCRFLPLIGNVFLIIQRARIVFSVGSIVVKFTILKTASHRWQMHRTPHDWRMSPTSPLLHRP